MIVHCMEKKAYEKQKNEKFICYEELGEDGFLHNSEVRHLHLVLPRFENKKEDYVLLCIDESKLIHELKCEYSPSLQRDFPHIYGPINTDAIIEVLDYLKDENGKYRKNPEFLTVADE